jgi:hypothetical protein
MENVCMLVTVSDVEVPVESATAFAQSWLYPTVTVAIGPMNMTPAVALTETPSVVVRVVDFSAETLVDTEVVKLCEISHDAPPVQLRLSPLTCWAPDFVWLVPMGTAAEHCDRVSENFLGMEMGLPRSQLEVGQLEVQVG